MKTRAIETVLAVLLLCGTNTGDLHAQTDATPSASPAQPGDHVAGTEGHFEIPFLRGVAVFDSYEQAKSASLSGIKGVKVSGPRFLNTRAFKRMLGRDLDQPVDMAGIRKLWTNVVWYCVNIGQTNVDVIIPARELDAPVVSIAVIPRPSASPAAAASAVAVIEPKPEPTPEPTVAAAPTAEPGAQPQPPPRAEPARQPQIVQRFDAELVSADAFIDNLKGIAVFESYDLAMTNDLKSISGVHIAGPAFLRTPEFESLLGNYLNRPIGQQGIFHLQTNVILYCRSIGHVVVDIILPPRPLDEGIIPVAIIEGKLSQLSVVVNGRTNDVRDLKPIQRMIGLKPGDALIEDQLVDANVWLQRINPFRRVSGANLRQSFDYKSGTTDYELEIQEEYPIEFSGRDRWPGKFYVGYENSGNEILGEDRLVTGVSWAKLWGWEHQANFQFLSDIDFDKLQNYAGSYIAPLPWRHLLTFYGYYADMEPDLSSLDLPSTFEQPGTAYQASMRYTVPLPRANAYFHEVQAGFDFKSADSDLLFGGVNVVSTPTEIDQFVLNYRSYMEDPYGVSALDGSGFYSPGGLTSHNEDEDFNTLRPEAKADYYYLRAMVERITKLPLISDWRSQKASDNYALALRGTVQYGPDPLLPSETLGLAGYDSVRGFEERIVNGDSGWFVNVELRSPEYQLARWIDRREGERLQFLAFYDVGEAKDEAPQGTEDQFTLSSVGGGVRLKVGSMLNVRVDVGIPVEEPDLDDPATDIDDYRVHASVLLSF